jgi:hypothetical protein
MEPSQTPTTLSTPAKNPLGAIILIIFGIILTIGALTALTASIFTESFKSSTQAPATETVPTNNTPTETLPPPPEPIGTSTIAPSVTTTDTLPSATNLSVGDTLGAFTITDIRIFDFVYPDGSQDFTITLSGETTVTGSVYVAMGAICIEPIESDLSNIPAIAEISSQRVCFVDDYSTVEQELNVDVTNSVQQTVKIKDFELRYSHKGGPGTISTFIEKLPNAQP